MVGSPLTRLNLPYSLTFGVLALILLALHFEVFGLLLFMQLARIALGGRIPIAQTFFELNLPGCGQRS